MRTLTIAIATLLCPLNESEATQKGMASWYGAENKRSCTGKPLHHKIPAVAHKTLPMGAHVKITSVRTKKSVVAIVEDRGPYTKGRIVDLNYTAAKQLGIVKDGVTKVTLERLK
jgi:rare lipoprotein A